MMYDSIVIGAGYAGLLAALKLQRSGQKVLLIAKGYGRTHLATGMVDVLGYHNGQRVEKPLEAVAQLAAPRTPAPHPYAHVSAHLRAGVELFLNAMAEAGYPFAGSVDENLLMPTAVGAVRPAAFVPQTMLAGDVRRGGNLVIVGFSNFKDFYAELIAANLNNQPPITARALTLPAPEFEHEADVAPMLLARAFDRKEFRRKLAAQIKPQLKAGERVGFPAVLGVNHGLDAWQDLENQLGTRVFEIPSLPPSIPGIRIFHALEQNLRQSGARVQIGHPIVEVKVNGTTVEAVAVKSAARLVWYKARHFVLATGGIAAHGLEVDSTGAVREPLFDLPVAHLPANGQPRFQTAYFAEHAFSKIGINVNAAMRPLNASGQPVFENLHVCGALLGGAEPWKEKSGEGISFASAFAAAQAIVNRIA